MEQQADDLARAQRTAYAKARRRRISLMRKVDQYTKLCDAEVYLVLFKNGRFYTYASTDNEHWPPPRSQIAQMYPVPQQYTPADFPDESQEGEG